MEDKSIYLILLIVGALLIAAAGGSIRWLRFPPPWPIVALLVGLVLAFVGACGILYP